jgi:hypothetical protein
MGLSRKEIGAIITSVIWQKNPDANASTIENSRNAKDCPRTRPHYSENPAAILSFSFNKATPHGFVPSSQLFKRTTGALHCTGTVARDISGDDQDLSDPVLRLWPPEL